MDSGQDQRDETDLDMSTFKGMVSEPPIELQQVERWDSPPVAPLSALPAVKSENTICGIRESILVASHPPESCFAVETTAESQDESQSAAVQPYQPIMVTDRPSVASSALENVRVSGSKPAQATAQASVRVATSTVEAKTTGNVLTRLLSIETISLHELILTDTQEWENEEAKLKYEKFSDFLRMASNDLSNAENDPLLHFHGRWLEHDLVLVQPSDDNAAPMPYIRFIGARNENEVRLLHASFSKKLFRDQYYPPLRICYVLQQPKSSAPDSLESEH
ncbi:hypothetical protein HJFPF1_10350 [Paramyrothecium foliicola]|nr:hypothetical protein HJFPF1_10350 [Paramyrothecium foliicola]